jgi:hypothetical protein
MVGPVAGWADAEIATIHALGGRCRGCRGGGCERSARAREALVVWARSGRVRAESARYVLDLAESGRGQGRRQGPLAADAAPGADSGVGRGLW